MGASSTNHGLSASNVNASSIYPTELPELAASVLHGAFVTPIETAWVADLRKKKEKRDRERVRLGLDPEDDSAGTNLEGDVDPSTSASSGTEADNPSGSSISSTVAPVSVKSQAVTTPEGMLLLEGLGRLVALGCCSGPAGSNLSPVDGSRN